MLIDLLLKYCKQILHSLNASPFHVIQQLDDVIGLLSSMVAAKIKDSLIS